MQKIFTLVLSLFLLSCGSETEKQSKTQVDKKVAIVIHGGAGGIDRSYFTEEQVIAYEETLSNALEAGYAILDQGGASIDAVQAAIIILEDSPLFNAGKGAVFNADGKQEMDASMMTGKDLEAGAIAGVHHIKNPILAARAVLDHSPHVLLSGDGAEILATEYGIEMVDPSYFYTDKRMQQLKKVQGKDQIQLDHSSINTKDDPMQALIDDHKFGTVGAVAIDKSGNIAAGTSTGGMTNKKYGRLGDVPIIGAGTYANNLTCGISCTGTGEYFIRAVAGHEISAKMMYQNKNLTDAMHEVIFEEIGPLGGEGGIIGIDQNGDVVWDFNSNGMFRAFKNNQGQQVVEMFEKTAQPIN